MQKRADALHGIGGVGKPCIGAVDFVVPAPHGERELISGRRDDARWPYLDIEFDWLARCQWPLLIMRVPRPVGYAHARIKLAMGSAKPTEADWHPRIVRADKRHLTAGRIEQAQHQEQIGVDRLR